MNERMQDVAWSPQLGPQSDLCECPLGEIFFGGARGGGKTDGVLGLWALKERRYKKHFNAIMFRPTTVSAEDAIERSRQIYMPLGGRFNESKLRWRMPNGGRVSFAYLESASDADVYQGRNVTDAWVEEAGQYPTPRPIDRLFGLLRSAHGVPTQLILTANPGGAGQHWIRERYRMAPFPKGPIVFKRGSHRVAVIPSRITDNRILLSADPEYVNRLAMVGSPQLVRAWLEGDWSAVEGAFFTEWSEEKHVVAPFAVPTDWLRFRSADWGSFAPFSIGWWAVASDAYQIQSGNGKLGDRLLSRGGAESDRSGSVSRTIPRGALVRYREWYGQVGGKLTAEQVANGIVQRERLDRNKLTYGVLDPSAFLESGGPSIAERINQVMVANRLATFRAADNRRVTRNIGDQQKSGPMGGWDQMRQRLIGNDGVPMLYCFSTCTDSIRTIPVLQHDDVRAEDLDSDAEDHAADEWRYAVMSRPWVKVAPKAERPPDGYRPPQQERDDTDSILLL
jgi:hypothetical protein